MADPILFDCGGSTRIKQILPSGAGDMRGLLDVQDLTDARGNATRILQQPGTSRFVQVLGASAMGSQHRIDLAAGDPPFASMLIMFQDAAGNPFTVRPALPQSFEILSHSGQKVRGDFLPNPNPAIPNPSLLITVYSNLTDPLIAGKQNRTDDTKRLRRRYVVDNAGPIKTITLNDTVPPATVVYDSSASEGLPGPPPTLPAPPATVPPSVGAAAAPGLPFYVSVMIG
jgi:hypothetical protein